MAEYTEKMTIAVSPALKTAIAVEAERQGRKPTAYARFILERVCLADQITIEQCAEEQMLEGLSARVRQTAEEFIAGKPHVEAS